MRNSVSILKLVTLTIVFTLVSVTLFAQGPPPPPPPPAGGCAACVPIDEGAVFLVLAGMAMVFKLRKRLFKLS